jgi:hypothetical protein
MRQNRAVPLVAVMLAFSLGSLSAHCAGPARAPAAIAAEPCPPPPCASSAPRPASLVASAAARVAAARKVGQIVRAHYEHGGGNALESGAAAELEFRAVRDSGASGPELIDAATKYAAAMRSQRELTVRLHAAQTVGDEDVARAEYKAAEADYWLEEAKAKR